MAKRLSIKLNIKVYSTDKMMNGTNFIMTLLCCWMFFSQTVVTVFNTRQNIRVA